MNFKVPQSLHSSLSRQTFASNRDLHHRKPVFSPAKKPHVITDENYSTTPKKDYLSGLNLSGSRFKEQTISSAMKKSVPKTVKFQQGLSGGKPMVFAQRNSNTPSRLTMSQGKTQKGGSTSQF